MLIMPGNHSSWFVHYWSGRCPGVFAHLWSPPRAIDIYPHLDYACDNYRFAATVGGKFWSAREFRRWIGQIKTLPKKPLFLVVPDLPFQSKATLEEWQVWEPELRELGVPLAFAVQDGIKLEQIPKSADWIFVGGTDEWRYPRLREITAMGSPVHVGRVNTLRRVRQCDEAGVASCDGNGWFRGDHYRSLEPYLHERQRRLGQSPQGGVVESGVGSKRSCAVGQYQGNLIVEPTTVPVLKRWQKGSAIPDNIQRHHLIAAIEDWHLWKAGWESNWRQCKQQRYWIAYEGKLYPAKQIVSIANAYANGQLLPVIGFSGGRDTNRFLKQRGFEIMKVEFMQERSEYV